MYRNNIVIICIAIIFCCFVISPAVKLLKGNYVSDDESLNVIRESSNIIKFRSFVFLDPLTSEKFTANVFTAFVALLRLFLSFEFIVFFLPLIMGIILLVCFFAILKHLGFDFEKIMIILTIFSLSPQFLYSLQGLNHLMFFSILICISLLIFFYVNSRIIQLVGFLILFCVMFTDMQTKILCVLLIFFGAFINRKSLGFLAIIVPILSIGIFFIKSNANLNSYILVSELGGIGISVFFLALAILGAGNLWSRRTELWSLYIVVIFLLVYSFIGYNFYFILLGSIFAGFGVVSLLGSKWKINLIKQLTAILFAVGLIFANVSFLMSVQENSSEKEALNFLFLQKNQVVLSSLEYGEKISTISEKKIISSAFFDLNSSDDLLKIRNPNLAVLAFRGKQIRYIFVDPILKERYSDDGIFFLLGKSEDFKLIYSKNGFEVWEFLNFGK